jgi:hypothetical protein
LRHSGTGGFGAVAVDVGIRRGTATAGLEARQQIEHLLGSPVRGWSAVRLIGSRRHGSRLVPGNAARPLRQPGGGQLWTGRVEPVGV